MKKLIVISFSFIVCSCLFCSCIKPKNHLISKETKDYCLFKEGSYWIYQDSLSNNIDSVVLIFSLHGNTKMAINGDGVEDIVETYTNKYCHYLSDTSIVLDYYIYADPSGGAPIWSYFPIIAFNSGVQYRILDIPYWDIQYSIIEYWIGEDNFNDVRIVVSNVTKSYWAKNVGLIRYEVYTTDNKLVNTYNLIRYNVSQ